MGVFPKRTLQNLNFLTTHAGHMKFSGWANMKKSFPKRGSPKLKLFNHEIVVPSFPSPQVPRFGVILEYPTILKCPSLVVVLVL